MKGVDLDPRPQLAADTPEMRVSFAPGVDRAEAVKRAIAVLRREGVVVLDQLVDPALLGRCREEIEAQASGWDQPDRARHIGSYPCRHTATLVID